jgi:hypothetical protein
MIDTGASISFYSQQVLDSLRSHQNLQHHDIQSYNRKLVVSLGDGSTSTAEESVDISVDVQFSTVELQSTG